MINKLQMLTSKICEKNRPESPPFCLYNLRQRMYGFPVVHFLCFSMKIQFCHFTICNVSVGAAFVSQTKHFPNDIIPYLLSIKFPGGQSNSLFKEKIKIAKELFDKFLGNLVFPLLLSTHGMLQLISLNTFTGKRIFFFEIKSNRACGRYVGYTLISDLISFNRL